MANGDGKTSGRNEQLKALLDLFAVLVLLGFGVFLVVDAWQGMPSVAAFSRVGGATRIETAVEASRFWLRPPQSYVETGVDASQPIMLGAARCAMVHDAPLLFLSGNPKRDHSVDVMIAAWRKDAKARRYKQALYAYPAFNESEAQSCLATGRRVNIDGLSTLRVPNPSFSLPREVPVRNSLAPVVVFAAAMAPQEPPDAAIALALAAHIATPSRAVSLVVVPRYLDADPQLEAELRKQGQGAKTGIVLGWPRALPEHTSTQLRQLLTPASRQDVLDHINTTLGSLQPMLGALFALLASVGAYKKRQEIKDLIPLAGRKVVEFAKKIGNALDLARWTFMGKPRGELDHSMARPPLVAWIAALRGDKDSKPKEEGGATQVVTVWLDSGWKVTGIITDQDFSPGNEGGGGAAVSTEAVLRITPPLEGDTADGATVVVLEKAEIKYYAKIVLVPVAEIQLICVEAGPRKRSETRRKQSLLFSRQSQSELL